MTQTTVASKSQIPNFPPLDGSLFLLELLEFNARFNSDVTFYVYDIPGSDVLVSVSHLDFYQACHRAAREITRKGEDKEVIALIGNCDTLLYQTVFIGALFAGLIPFPMSPRNSVAAVVSMMQKTKCYRLITTSHNLGSLIGGVQADFASHANQTSQLCIDGFPALKGLYPALVGEPLGEPFIPYPPPISRPSANDILFYLHSSGSTGIPKPIPMTNLTAVHWCMSACMFEHIESTIPIRVDTASLPSFHTLGIYVQLLIPITSLSSVSIYPPTSFLDPFAAPIIPNLQNILNSIIKTKSNALVVVPAFLEQWAFSSDAIDILKTLEYVVFAGGPLSPKIGNSMVNAGVKLSSMYGATECGDITYFFRNEVEQKLWEWVRFGPNSKIRWVPQDDGTYECQVLTTATHQVSVENLPDVKGYATSDAFIKHPTVDGLWKIVGRLDDIIVLSSGEKAVPAPMESIIGASPCVNGVVMFGHGRNQVGVLIEPRPGNEIATDDEIRLTEFRNRVWPDIEEANVEAPSFSRIVKEMILVTKKEKPMLRAGKGTVTKKATIKLYEEEIDALYKEVEGSTTAGINVPLPTKWNAKEVEAWLTVHAAAVNAGKAVHPGTDFFSQGFDSLSATFLKNRIIGSLRSSSDRQVQESASRIQQDIIFSSPSIRQLTRSIVNMVQLEDDLGAGDAEADIENMIEKYSIGFGDFQTSIHPVTTPGDHSRRNHVVVLTGSTGGLGSYLLASLLQRDEVSTVYAFNRPSAVLSIQQRQKGIFEDRGLDVNLLQSEKLIHVETDTSDVALGLGKELYQKICTSVTVIIHNAWKVDFNLALSSLESQVRGARNLMDLALSSPRHPKPRFMFTSSISSAQNWDQAKGPFPEEIQYDAGVAVGMGYGESKYISERVLVNSRLPASSFRLGQITGGIPRGAWSTTDWLPIIVKSSMSLGALPRAPWLINWIPPYAVSGAVLDVAFAEENPPIVVNIVHPRPTAWNGLVQSIADAMFEQKVTGVLLPLIPFSEWLEKLECSGKNMSEGNVKRIPAIKIIDYIRRIAQLGVSTGASGEVAETEHTPFATNIAQQVSYTMKALEPLTSTDAARWVDYWVAVGMFK